jgi:hypothetical protein
MSNFVINGRGIKNPSQFKIERFNITNMERLANAEMVGDIIAKKRKFYFTYDAIDSSDLNVILSAIWDSDDLFFPLEYIENGVSKSAIVYVGSIPTELHRVTSNNHWVWKNVTFNLIEK